MNLPTIPESIYAAAWRRWLQSGEDDCRPSLAECLDAVWPDLHALAVASLPADLMREPSYTQGYAAGRKDAEQAALAVASLPAAPAVLPEITDKDTMAAFDAWYEKGDVRDRRWALVARAVRDSLAARMPVWQPIEPGTVIKAGTRVRCEWGIAPAFEVEEFTARADWPTTDMDGTFSIDPRTVPADPDADLIRTIEDIDQSLHGAPDGTWGRGFLDALATAGLCIEPKPTTGPLGGAR